MLIDAAFNIDRAACVSWVDYRDSRGSVLIDFGPGMFISLRCTDPAKLDALAKAATKGAAALRGRSPMPDIDDGGPAFPTDSERQVGPDTWHYEGMSLRDRFATQAMVPYITLAGTDEGSAAMAVLSETAKINPRAIIAKACYQMADAMLAARKEKP